MPRRRTIFGMLTDAAIFIVLEIAAIGMLDNTGKLQNFFICKAAHGFMGSVWGVTESLSEYLSLREENRKLSQEVFELTRRQSGWNRLRGQADMDSVTAAIAIYDERFSFISADIIKSSRGKQHNYLIIGKGSEDGIRPQSGVMTANGVIGIVDAVSRHYSYVISFLNSEINISSRIGGSGAVGTLSWDGIHPDRALLRDIPIQSKSEKGDTVFTSGFSSIFPADIPLGVIEDSKIVNGATYEFGIHLFQDYSSVRYVTVVSNRSIDEIAELEMSEGARQEAR